MDLVNGGIGDVSTQISEAFQTAGLPILDGECSLHHQASFYETFWNPEGGDEVEVASNGDIFGYARLLGSDGKPIGNPEMGAPTVGAPWSDTELKERVENKADFAELARVHSDDASASMSGASRASARDSESRKRRCSAARPTRGRCPGSSQAAGPRTSRLVPVDHNTEPRSSRAPSPHRVPSP
mgnify:CR=1 FL=1